jgi:hypothetical protein
VHFRGYSLFLLCAFAPLRETNLIQISRKGAKAQRNAKKGLILEKF